MYRFTKGIVELFWNIKANDDTENKRSGYYNFVQYEHEFIKVKL